MGIRTTLHPAWYQGRTRGEPYFEGWYFKMATQDMVLAIIPGISKAPGDHHAFIQVIAAKPRKSWYIRYSVDQFQVAPKDFIITIASNRFSYTGVCLDIDTEDLHLHGSVDHQDIQPYPVSILRPGIMGWYAYVPFMECFHGVVSTNHKLDGALVLNGESIEFTGGKGYIEKDWGTSFPSAWVWMQSNCFPSSSTSCMLSVARIPFLQRTFTGFLGFVRFEERLITFATYTNASIEMMDISQQTVRIVIRTKQVFIEFMGDLGPASRLTAPRQGKMERSITESVSGSISLTASDFGGRVLYQETSSMAGMELSEAHQLATNHPQGNN